jgi:aarF domain-containing kinase
MEYCHGHRADDLEKMKVYQLDVNKVSKRLGMIFSEMIFKNGFVHCDPHPGNILINPICDKTNEFEIILLDHGIYQVKLLIFIDIFLVLQIYLTSI